MQVWFIFSLLFSLIVAAFAVLNSEVVTIKFFGMNYELAQSAVILVSAVFGAAIAVFLGLLSRIKSSLKIRELTNKLKNAEKQIELLSESVKNYERNASVNASGNTAGDAPVYSPGIAAASREPADSGQSESSSEE